MNAKSLLNVLVSELLCEVLPFPRLLSVELKIGSLCANPKSHVIYCIFNLLLFFGEFNYFLGIQHIYSVVFLDQICFGNVTMKHNDCTMC